MVGNLLKILVDSVAGDQQANFNNMKAELKEMVFNNELG
jgi:hypothetical protein